MIPPGLPRQLGLALTIALAAALPLQALTPEWSPGLSWTVATIYRKAQLGRPPAGQPMPPAEWTEPTRWLFRIAQTDRKQDGTHYLVQVRNAGGGASSMAALEFAAFDLPGAGPALSLVEGKYMRWVRGQRLVTERTENTAGDSPRPVLSEQSLIPYDFPATPLPEPGAPIRKRTFEITEQLPPLSFAKDVVQTEQSGLDPATIAGDDLDRIGKLPLPPRDKMVFVTLERAMDGSTTRQIWAPGLPWPLYSDDGDSRSVLVEIAKPADGSGATPPTTR